MIVENVNINVPICKCFIYSLDLENNLPFSRDVHIHVLSGFVLHGYRLSITAIDKLNQVLSSGSLQINRKCILRKKGKPTYRDRYFKEEEERFENTNLDLSAA